MSDADLVINLSKGDTIDLTKHAPAVTKFYVGLGWDSTADLDVSVFPCEYNSAGDPHLISPPYFIFYNQLTSPCGGIVHSPDVRDGTGTSGDDEFIIIDTAKIDPRILEIAHIVTIDGAPANGINFGQVKDAYIRICELSGADQPGREIARYRLDEGASDSTAVQFGSLLKRGSGWEFEAVGSGYVADLGAVVKNYMPEAKIKQ